MQLKPWLDPKGIAMNHANQLFADAVRIYPDFKDLFERFCAEMKRRLTENAQLPGVTVSPGQNGASVILQALDRTFHISLDFLMPDGTPWGLLRVALLGENKEPIQLFHLFFDHLGNVKETPHSSAAPHSLPSTDFVKRFLNRLTLEHFSRLSSNLK